MANSQLSVTIKGRDELTSTVKDAQKSLQNLNSQGGKALGSIAEQFHKIEASGAPLKKQLREMQKLLGEMNFNGLSNTQLYTEIAQKAGAVKDAISDAATSVKRFSDDTMTLRAAADAFTLVSAGASVATGAMGLFGVESENVKNAILKVQSAIAILNGVQTIANSLNKDSALLQKLKQLSLNAEAAAQAKAAAATTVNTAATTAQTNASKAATIAQYAFNTAIAANPISATVIALTAAATAVFLYATRASEAAKESRALAEEMKNHSSSLAENRVRLEQLRAEWEALTSDQQRVKWLKDNASEFQKLGVSVTTVADAENILVTNTSSFIEAMTLRAEAAAAAALAQKEYQNAIEKQEQARDRRANPTRSDKALGILYVGNDFDFSSSINKQARNAAGQMEREASQSTERAERYLKRSQELANRAKALENQRGIRRYTPTTTGTTRTSTGRTGGSTRTTTGGTLKQTAQEAQAAAGSINALNAQISDLETKLKNGVFGNGTDAEKNALKTIEDLRKKVENEEIRLHFKPDENAKTAKKFADDAQKAITNANAKIALQVEPATTHQDRRAEIDSITSSKTGLDALMAQWDAQASKIEDINDKISRQKEIISELSNALDNARQAYALVQNDENKTRVNEVTEALAKQNAVLAEMGETLNTATDGYNSLYNSARRAAKRSREQKKNAEQMQGYSDAISSASTAFANLGNIMKNAGDESGAAFMSAFSAIIGGAGEIATQVQKLIELRKTATVAAEGEALASGAASAAKLPFPASLGAIAAIVATLFGVFAQISSLKFASGGIVPGTSYSGDNVHAMLNSGEMVLNRPQQARLFGLLNGGSGGGREITLRVRGTDLVGTLSNYNKLTAKTKR